MIVKNASTGQYIIVSITSEYYKQIILNKYGVNISAPKKEYSEIIKERLKKLY
jgi:hypothetical protein